MVGKDILRFHAVYWPALLMAAGLEVTRTKQPRKKSKKSHSEPYLLCVASFQCSHSLLPLPLSLFLFLCARPCLSTACTLTRFLLYLDPHLHLSTSTPAPASAHAVHVHVTVLSSSSPRQPPQRLFAHGWWTKDGAKISKSVGNVIDPLELVQTFGIDQVFRGCDVFVFYWTYFLNGISTLCERFTLSLRCFGCACSCLEQNPSFSWWIYLECPS